MTHPLHDLRSLVALFVVALSCTVAKANDVYLAQGASGANTGQNCANAYVYTFFNNPSNWGTGANQIGPGTTVHICGTWTGSAGQKFLTAQGSGSSGSPVTIRFETNAVMQAPYLSPTGAIVLSRQSYIVVDGGTNGLIQSTLNGSPGATCPGGPCSDIQPSVAIVAMPCANCEFKNLTIANLYVHRQCETSSGCDTSISQIGVNAIQFQGSNVLIHDNTFHDIGWVLFQNYTNDSRVQIYNNNIYNMDHGLACAGADYIVPSMSVYGNHFHDMAAWDTGMANAYHHDGIHCYNGSGGKIQNLYIYNNVFDGNEGQNISSWIFLEGGSGAGRTPWTDSTGTAYIFNNVVIGTYQVAQGQVNLNRGTGHLIANNTILAGGAGNGSLLAMTGTGGDCSNITIENNVLEDSDQAINAYYATSYRTIDYNAYANFSGGNPFWQFGSGLIKSNAFSTWQSLCKCDSHSIYQAYPNAWVNLSSEGVPAAGFAGIGVGANLTNLGIVALDSDRLGVVRPGSGPWTIGAYQYAAAGPNPPTGLSAIAH